MAIQIIMVYQKKKAAAAYSNAFPYYSLIWGQQLPEFNVIDNLSSKEFDKKKEPINLWLSERSLNISID